VNLWRNDTSKHRQTPSKTHAYCMKPSRHIIANYASTHWIAVLTKKCATSFVSLEWGGGTKKFRFLPLRRIKYKNIDICRPVARQRPRDKELHNNIATLWPRQTHTHNRWKRCSLCGPCRGYITRVSVEAGSNSGNEKGSLQCETVTPQWLR
jgi:hypothetical protein